mgnify:CR=1 FL=1
MTNISRRELLAGAGASLVLGGSASPILAHDKEDYSIDRAVAQALFEPNDNKLKNPELAKSHPHLHYAKDISLFDDLEHIKILVESDSRNMFIVKHTPKNPQSLEEILFRAPVILGRTGRRANGKMYTSSFSGPEALWRPKEDPHNPRRGVFGRFFMPMQSQDIPVDEYIGEWGPYTYNMYAIHGTNYNEAFESRENFMATISRGCVRVFDVAIDDLRNIIEQSAQSLRKIEADYRNPTNDAYVLGRTIPVKFGRHFPQIRNLI